MKTALRAALLFALALGRSLRADAQGLPSEPIALADGHVSISGDAEGHCASLSDDEQAVSAPKAATAMV